MGIRSKYPRFLGFAALATAAMVLLGSMNAGLAKADNAPKPEALPAPTMNAIYHRIKGAAQNPTLLPSLPTVGKAASNGILYHGGPVMLGTPKIHVIWYGNWSGNTATTILPDMISHLGGSPYYNINTTYYNAANQHVSNALALGTQITDSYSRGSSLSDADIQTIVSAAISSGKLPSDTNALYGVFTSSDVNETSGFLTQYCGWHTQGTIGGKDIKYMFVGDPARNYAACAGQSASSPNNNISADAMASVIAHEIEETTSDPDLNAWYDSRGNENADKCAWTWGTTYKTSNGATANMKLGTRDYLIQRNWLNASGGSCQLKY